MTYEELLADIASKNYRESRTSESTRSDGLARSPLGLHTKSAPAPKGMGSFRPFRGLLLQSENIGVNTNRPVVTSAGEAAPLCGKFAVG
jgi:hypothetical protein